MAPDECNPMCIVRGARTLPVPANASGNSSDFSSQGPGHRGPPQHRGASQLERRQSRHPRAPFPARRGSFTPPGGSNRGVTPPPDKKAAATPLPGEAEFPALCAPAGHATRNQPKVGSWAKVASSPPPHPSCPTSTAETQELKHELSLLRAQNENTASERNLLRTQFGTPLSSSGEEENIPDRQLPTPSESRVVAQETQVTETERHLAGLPKIVHYTIARQMDSVIIQVTQAVTRIIQKWIQDNPRVLKRVEPIRDDNRSSNFNRVIPDESDFSEDSCTSALGTSELGSVNNVTPASMTDLGPQPKWNCRGLKDRKIKRGHLRLYLETLELLVAVVALQEPGAGVKLTNYTTFQQNPQTYPANPTRVGNAIQRDTCPDLTVTCNIRHADWLNTEHTLGSDHCIINATICMRPLKRPLTQARVPEWTSFRSSLPIVDPRQSGYDTYLTKQWRKQKENRRLKKRIIELTQQAAEYAAQLADTNWVGRCNAAAHQMSGRNTWRLFRALIDPTQTRTETQRHLHRSMHNFAGTTTQLAHTLKDR
ncbi:hypothetical protein HPB49_024914 [Dermacentor silvarum]|uniref:Uncharacterized protein n=1 Tax=Dermacentor silvarum TaxID=543639 RepID=A0ACB8DHJ2_DERSI|nr:hypothetical protein HPB49_024914 [Dermacentor silvarum]